MEITIRKLLRSKNAFTLIELLVVGAILMVVSIVISQITIATIRANLRTQRMRQVKQNGDFVIDTITRYIQDAVIDTGAGFVCNPTGSTANISVSGVRIEENIQETFVIQCQNDGSTDYSNIGITVDGAEVSNLTGNQVTLVNPMAGSGQTVCESVPFTIRCYSDETGTYPQKLSIEFSLKHRNNASTVNDTIVMDFSQEVSLRNNQIE